MKCRYSRCKHGGEVNKNDAVKEGKSYYHPDCLAEKNALKEIIDIFHKRVDDHPIESYLRRTVDDLVFKDGNSADYLLFAFKYCLDHGWHLNSPGGLRYVAKDVKAKKEWEKKQTAKFDFPKMENEGTEFTYKPLEQKSIDNLFNG